ncbi:hypothetical protein CK203_099204 [Vitis vinifera]|uniref:DUF659 domain-containing protein n=1 Tax=Vitis vinifera TaxID=29760 RepID=A0A438DMN6_VITVI|nr:hypothetical protein CK203_099204 [Vitis vinifera]
MKQAMKESRRIFEEDGQEHQKGGSSSQPSNARIKRGLTRSFSVREGASILQKELILTSDSGPYYQSMIDTIAEAGLGIKGLTGYQIGNTYLEEEVTRKSIINFMIYCDRSMIYHFSVDTTNIPKTTDYIFSLMDKVVEEVGEENVVQVVTDNKASFKATGMLLMEKRKLLSWFPCAVHCIDLMLEDIGSMKKIKETLDQAKMITGFIYNSLKVVNLMKVFTKDRDLLKPGITRFATEFISLESLIRY